MAFARTPKGPDIDVAVPTRIFLLPVGRIERVIDEEVPVLGRNAAVEFRYAARNRIQHRIKQRREWYRAEARRLAKRRGKLYPECTYVVQYHGTKVGSQIAKAWNQAKKDAGITKRIRPYNIRHFHITHALATGANLMELAARVGHKGPEMIVRVYAHLVEEMKQKNALEIPELFPSGKKGCQFASREGYRNV